MEKELKYLTKAINDFPQPSVVLLGGVKIGDKMAMIYNMIIAYYYSGEELWEIVVYEYKMTKT